MGNRFDYTRHSAGMTNKIARREQCAVVAGNRHRWPTWGQTRIKKITAASYARAHLTPGVYWGWAREATWF